MPALFRATTKTRRHYGKSIWHYESPLIEAVKQVTEKGKTVADVAQRLGMSVHSLYAWIKLYSKPQEQRQQDDEQQAELRKLRAELKRVTEERDILKKAAAYFAKECN